MAASLSGFGIPSSLVNRVINPLGLKARQQLQDGWRAWLESPQYRTANPIVRDTIRAFADGGANITDQAATCMAFQLCDRRDRTAS